MNGVVRKDALEPESVSLPRKLVSTWQSTSTCSAGVCWNSPTILEVVAGGMTTNKDCWACAMVNCYLVTCEVVDQPRAVVAMGVTTGATTTEVHRWVVLTVTMGVDGLAETLEVLEKSSNQASMDGFLASSLGSRCPDDPDNPLAFLAVVQTGAMRCCCALEVVNYCYCPDCPDSA